MLYFSVKTSSFYDTAVHGTDIPDDSIEVTSDQRRDLIAAIADGMTPSCVDGVIQFADAPPPSASTLAWLERTWRDAEVIASEWLVLRHRDEQDLSLTTTLAAGKFAELLMYRQSLRNWPQSSDFPNVRHRPEPPDWLIALSQ